MKNAIVGHTGIVGNILKQQANFKSLFNSSNIELLKTQYYDQIFCAVPTGNRLWANTNADQDLENIKSIINELSQCKTKKFVLISTVDTQLLKNTPYGKSRLLLENEVKEIFDDYCIIRLCSLIHPSIRKNLLYDIKHNQFLDSVNAGFFMQWYPMHRLLSDIKICMQNQLTETNLVSEPIQNKTILKKFCPQIQTKLDSTVNSYNFVCDQSHLFNGYNKYINSADEILKYMENYLGY